MERLCYEARTQKIILKYLKMFRNELSCVRHFKDEFKTYHHNKMTVSVESFMI